MKKVISTLALLLLVTPFFSPSGLCAEEEDTRFPYQATVVRGTAAGTVAQMTGIDSSYYSVAEEDVGGILFTNTTLNPNLADGTDTQWFFGIGPAFPCDAVTHWGCVADGPPSPGDGDVSYVNQPSLASTVYDSYLIQDYTLAPGHTIDEVRVYGTARLVIPYGQGASGYRVCVYSGVITRNCDILPDYPPQVYTEYTYTWVVDPNTGLPWTDAGVDAMEIGQRTNNTVQSEISSTLMYAVVQSQGAIVDYTADFRLDFQGIEHSDEPKLVVTGYRGGDAETITLQILRNGAWTTLSANAFGAASATTQYDLSKLDVAGGSASVRIVDNDATDDTQSTIYIDEMKIITTGESSDPAAPVDVYVHLSYDLWGNKIIVEVTWIQTGGREPGKETGKWAILTADGVEMGSYQVGDRLTVDAPWSWFDGNDHIVNATGVVNVVFQQWGHNQTYYSEPDTMHVSNFPRWAIILILVFVVCAIIAIFAVSALKRAKEYGEYEERKD